MYYELQKGVQVLKLVHFRTTTTQKICLDKYNNSPDFLKWLANKILSFLRLN